MTDKALIRKDALLRRDAIRGELRKSKDSDIRERLLGLNEFNTSTAILLYASFKSEVDTFELLKYCLSSNKTVVLPRVNETKDALILYEIKEIGELTRGHFGVPEPAVSEERRRDIAEIGMVIVPGVAFDVKCNRLGYGKGFYDKLLGKKTGVRDSGLGIRAMDNNLTVTNPQSPIPNPCIIGLAYEEQIAQSIPSEPHDMKMDKIITDKRIITCNG